MSASVRLLAPGLLIALVIAACGGTGSGAPSPSAPASASGGPASTDCPPSASACAYPSESGAVSATPLAGFSCPIGPTKLVPPSNRLVDIAVTARDGYDEVAFVFGPPGAGNGSTPVLRAEAATPPFVQGGSGLPLTVDGQAFIELTFSDMVVADEQGAPTYGGAAVIRPGTPAVVEVVQAEAFEGVVRWIVGARSPGCARVGQDAQASRIVVDVGRP